MKVFISWSGERSRRAAEALRSWLPDIIQEIDPWISSKDISAGARGGREIADSLSMTNFGIVCITPENRSSEWIQYEAGALSKEIDQARVVPFLIGIKVAELTGPLKQFQAVAADSADDVRKLVIDINNTANIRSLSPDRLDRLFHRSWPDLENILSAIRASAPGPGQGQPKVPGRSEAEMLEEVLLLSRQHDRRLAEIERNSLRPPRSLPRWSRTEVRRRDDDASLEASFADIGWEAIHSFWENGGVIVVVRRSGHDAPPISRDFIGRVANSFNRTVVVIGESGNLIARGNPRQS
ncbi:toll/interleukin-1 receptor domain-containing protein [Kitasatospora sp. NPDC059463]|uniref:toll/interleukin-1 receptor domain-containing protein n=1 Tax=unclassified Kitasatospora TaxID=2633591 RepID=UPI0036A0798E